MSKLFNVVLFQGVSFQEIHRQGGRNKRDLGRGRGILFFFSRTLDRGEKLFDQFASWSKESGLNELNGKDVWRLLYDTFGFPVDLTRLMAEELGLSVDEEGFEAAQAMSRKAIKASLKK